MTSWSVFYINRPVINQVNAIQRQLMFARSLQKGSDQSIDFILPVIVCCDVPDKRVIAEQQTDEENADSIISDGNNEGIKRGVIPLRVNLCCMLEVCLIIVYQGAENITRLSLELFEGSNGYRMQRIMEGSDRNIE